MTPQEMRRQRVREIITKYADMAAAQIEPSKKIEQREQEDDARFVSKYFDIVSNKQYQQFFCQYNQPMFAKVIKKYCPNPNKVIGIHEVLRTSARRVSFQKRRQLQTVLFPTQGKNRNDS
jgi:hypothetical protein